MISRNTKARLYQTLVIPVLLYSYKTWKIILEDDKLIDLKKSLVSRYEEDECSLATLKVKIQTMYLKENGEDQYSKGLWRGKWKK